MMAVQEGKVDWVAYPARVEPGSGTKGLKAPEPQSKSDEIRTLTGIAKVPGSLNLRLAQRVWFRRGGGIRWSAGYLYPARIGGIDLVATRPRRVGKPEPVRLYADRHVKTALGIADGDVVYLEVPRSVVVRFRLPYDLLYLVKRAWWRIRDSLSPSVGPGTSGYDPGTGA